MEQRKVKKFGSTLNRKFYYLETDTILKTRSSHPLVDDIDFRRILGMSETISAWNWPDIDTIDAVSAT